MKGNTAAEPPQNPPWYYGQGRLYPVGLLCFGIVLVFIAIREAHKDDTDSAPDDSNAMKLIKDAKKALAVPGSCLDVFTALMCTQLQIRYEKLSEQERTVLKNVMKKTPTYKDSPLSRMKRR